MLSIGRRPLIVPAILLLIGAVAVARAQPASRSGAAPPTGTYASRTTRLPDSSGRDGCWLEVAPTTADSMRVQILCRNPAPGYHLGVLDARLRRDGDTVVYERGDSTDHCRIRVRFADARALVLQEGTDQACGFGAYVNVSGTYVRLSRRRPPFDLAP